MKHVVSMVRNIKSKKKKKKKKTSEVQVYGFLGTPKNRGK